MPRDYDGGADEHAAGADNDHGDDDHDVSDTTGSAGGEGAEAGEAGDASEGESAEPSGSADNDPADHEHDRDDSRDSSNEKTSESGEHQVNDVDTSSPANDLGPRADATTVAQSGGEPNVSDSSSVSTTGGLQDREPAADAAAGMSTPAENKLESEDQLVKNFISENGKTPTPDALKELAEKLSSDTKANVAYDTAVDKNTGTAGYKVEIRQSDGSVKAYGHAYDANGREIQGVGGACQRDAEGNYTGEWNGRTAGPDNFPGASTLGSRENPRSSNSLELGLGSGTSAPYGRAADEFVPAPRPERGAAPPPSQRGAVQNPTPELQGSGVGRPEPKDRSDAPEKRATERAEASPMPSPSPRFPTQASVKPSVLNDLRLPKFGESVSEPAGPSHVFRGLRYIDLFFFAQMRGFHVTADKENGHNPGSKHPKGLAVDVRIRDKTPREIEAFMREAQAAGINVRPEGKHPAGQKVWTGPHLHLSVDEKTRINSTEGDRERINAQSPRSLLGTDFSLLPPKN